MRGQSGTKLRSHRADVTGNREEIHGGADKIDAPMDAEQVAHRSRVIATKLRPRYQHGDARGQIGVGGAAA